MGPLRTLIALRTFPRPSAVWKVRLSVVTVPFSAGETEIVVSLANTGRQAINLPSRPGWDEEGGLTLSLTQVNGARVNRPAQDEEPMRRAVRSRGQSTMVLEGGEAQDYFHVLQLGDLIKSPGTYRLVVTYRRVGQAELVSEPAEILVVE